MNKNMIKSIGAGLSALTLGLVLTACDGSGKAPAVNTGQLVDAAVQGATYKATPSGLAGVTDKDGNYNYQAGDKVVFSFGNVVFPAVEAKGTVTPLDLAGTTDINNKIVVNIARFLQTLDSDSNPDNGITIDPATVADALQFNFDQDPADFADDFAEAFPTTPLVTIEDAIAHLQGELDELNGNGQTTPTVESVLPAGLSGKNFDLYFFPGGDDEGPCDFEEECGPPPGCGPGGEFECKSSASIIIPDICEGPECGPGECIPEGVPHPALEAVNFAFASDGTLTITWPLPPAEVLDDIGFVDGDNISVLTDFTLVDGVYRWIELYEETDGEDTYIDTYAYDVILDEQGNLQEVIQLYFEEEEEGEGSFYREGSFKTESIAICENEPT